MTIVLVTAVAAEAEAIGEIQGARVVVAGIGRTNAAAATTEIARNGHTWRKVVNTSPITRPSRSIRASIRSTSYIDRDLYMEPLLHIYR